MCLEVSSQASIIQLHVITTISSQTHDANMSLRQQSLFLSSRGTYISPTSVMLAQ